jgi:hypothetical protein
MSNYRLIKWVLALQLMFVSIVCVLAIMHFTGAETYNVTIWLFAGLSCVCTFIISRLRQ